MIIKHFKYFPFLLKLKTPFQTSYNKISDRKGFIVSITDEHGNTSYGECSPLPEFSRETIDDADTILKNMIDEITGAELNDNTGSICEFLSTFKLVPSVRFALEQAIFNVMAMRNKNFLNSSFGKFNSQVSVNAVIGFGRQEDIIKSISIKYDAGFRTFKIKVGRSSFEDDIKLIGVLREKFGNSINIRLDVNGKWEFDTAKEPLNSLKTFGIQYIEEPCKGFQNLCLLAESSQIPVAIDESILSIRELNDVITRSKIDFIILKPAIFGTLIAAEEFIKQAGNNNKKIIISSSFESAIGKSALVMLAASSGHSYAHGLDTSGFFERDICKDFYNIEDAHISFNPENYPPQFDISLL